MWSGAVRVDSLSAGYRRRKVLNSVSWNFGPGVVGLLGPNGAGKTTLIKCLVGLMRPSNGTIFITSTDGPAMADQRRVGYVPQRASLPGSMTVQAIVEYYAWLKGVPSAKVTDAANSSISNLNLAELRERRAKSLSGGQAQRVAIAAALAHSPSLLILDEPTVGLDPTHRLAVRRSIKALESVETILISTHMIEDVEHLCSDIGVLNHGRLQFAGTIEDLLAQIPDQPGSDGSAFELAYAALVGDD